MSEIKKSKIRKTEWKEFHNTGLLFYINTILHVFGWCLVFEMEHGEILNVYPARTEYRGFAEDTQEEEYIKISEYLAENAEQNHQDFLKTIE